MALEPVSFLDDLVVTNPTDTDPVSEGDNHIRNLKIALAAAISADATDVRLLAGGANALEADAAEVRLLIGAVLKFLLNSSGLFITGFDIELDNETDAAASLKLINSIGGGSFSMRQTSGDLRIFELDALGVFIADWMHFNKAGGNIQFHNGLEIYKTLANGISCGHVLANDDDTLLELLSERGWEFRAVSNGATTGLELFSKTSGKKFTIGDGVFVGAEFQPDGQQILRHTGLDALKTTQAGNSSLEVFDSNGVARVVGYNVMPRNDVTADRSVRILDNGQRLRFQTSNVELTLADVLSDMAFNVYVNTGGTTGIIVPSGFTLRHYAGDQVIVHTGPVTLNMNAGSALTFIQFSATSWDCWGGLLDGL